MLSAYLQLFFLLINTIVLVAGAAIAWVAVKQYKKQNEISMEKTLVDADRMIWNRIEREPALDAFFVECESGIAPRLQAVRRLEALVQGTGFEIKQLKNIFELEGWLWERMDFSSPVKSRLRAAYGVAEAILYVISLAYDAKQKKLLCAADYISWTNYIDTVGGHPIFLCAVNYWRNNGFASKDFFDELRRRLLQNNDNKNTLQQLFPDFLV